MEEGYICSAAAERIPLSIKWRILPLVVFLAYSSAEVSHFSWVDLTSQCLMFLLRSGSVWRSHAGFYIQLSSLMECKWVDSELCPSYFCCLGCKHQLCGHSLLFFYSSCPISVWVYLTFNSTIKNWSLITLVALSHSRLEKGKEKVKTLFVTFVQR